MKLYGKLVSSVLMGIFVCASVGCIKKGAADSAVSESPQVSASACAGNLYLEKYNCSLDDIQQAALIGNPDAQYALGYMYYNGVGTVKDEQTGELWIQRAAQQGQPLAQKAQSIIEADQDSSASQMTATAHAQPSLQGTSVTSIASSSDAVRVSDPRLKQGSSPQMAADQSSSATLASSSNSMNSKESHYTIQLMGSYDKVAIERFVTRASLTEETHITQSAFNGKPWFTLVYGDYRSIASAKSAIAALPLQLQTLQPWVKPYPFSQDGLSQQQTT